MTPPNEDDKLKQARIVEPATPSRPVDPPDSPSAVTPEAPVNPELKTSKKRRLLLPILIIVGVLALSGSAFATYSWYQNPQKVITDALVNVMDAKTLVNTGTISLTSEDADATFTFDGQAKETSGQQSVSMKITPKDSSFDMLGEIKAKGEFVYSDDGAFYFKVSELKTTYEKIRDTWVDTAINEYREDGYTFEEGDSAAIKTQADSIFLPIVEKIDNQWIKVTASDIDETIDADDNVTSCLTDAVTKARNDKAITKEIADVYKEHTFITVDEELGSKDGAVGYLLGLDKDTAKDFGKALENTTLGKDIMACNPEDDEYVDYDDASETVDEATENGQIEIWIDRWSHQIERVVVEAKDDDSSSGMKIDLKTDFGAETDIQIPSDARSFDEIQSDIESITGGVL